MRCRALMARQFVFREKQPAARRRISRSGCRSFSAFGHRAFSARARTGSSSEFLSAPRCSDTWDSSSRARVRSDAAVMPRSAATAAYVRVPAAYQPRRDRVRRRSSWTPVDAETCVLPGHSFLDCQDQRPGCPLRGTSLTVRPVYGRAVTRWPVLVRVIRTSTVSDRPRSRSPRGRYRPARCCGFSGGGELT